MPSALLDTLLLHGKQAIPPLLYKAAGKQDKTANVVYEALISGYKGVDTVAEPQHQREDLAGAGVRRALSEGKISRNEMFIQGGFVPVNYPTASISEQIHSSIRSSLRHMRPSEEESSSESTYLDCLVLRSPFSTFATMAQTLEAWRIAETYVPHKIRYLGISWATRDTLEQLYDAADIKPAVVRSRAWLNTTADCDVRAFCAERGIIYQFLWKMAAGKKLINSPEVHHFADQVGLHPHQAAWVLVLALENVVAISGPTNLKHMEFELSCFQRAREWALEHPAEWSQCLEDFKKLLR